VRRNADAIKEFSPKSGVRKKALAYPRVAGLRFVFGDPNAPERSLTISTNDENSHRRDQCCCIPVGTFKSRSLGSGNK
jgi:hypothetical protein